MTFKELKQNYAVHILRKEGVLYSQGKVVSVSNPRFPSSSPSVPFSFSQTGTQVVDVTIEEAGQQTTYTIPETFDVAYANDNLVLSTTREKIQLEIETMMHNSEDQLASVDKHKRIVELCKQRLSEINPSLKEKQQVEARFTSIENKMGTMLSMMQELAKKLE